MLVVIMVMKYGVMLRSAEMLFLLLPHGKTVMLTHGCFFFFLSPLFEKLGYAGNRPFF